MRAFGCPVCRSLVFFENSVCVTCGSALGFDRAAGEIVSVTASALHPCANLRNTGCNWLTEQHLCGCCELTRTRPPDHDFPAMAAWARTEAAKRRLIYQLDRLSLPTTTRAEDPSNGLAFDLLSSRDAPVITGHEDGVITIDLAEGDDPHREARRVQLAEQYRTLLGHLRHEIGHWYWDVLVDATSWLEQFRELFGDERADYRSSLNTHYAKDPMQPFDSAFVSFYASAHPWEDWAETFAQYLHIRDAMQTAAAWGMQVQGPDAELLSDVANALSATPTADPDSFQTLIETWLPLSFALNAVNRSMGKEDLYPFVLTPAVLEKLRFVHTRVVGG